MKTRKRKRKQERRIRQADVDYKNISLVSNVHTSDFLQKRQTAFAQSVHT